MGWLGKMVILQEKGRRLLWPVKGERMRLNKSVLMFILTMVKLLKYDFISNKTRVNFNQNL